MKKRVFEDIAVDDVIIQDPNIANQIVQTQKQINDRLKIIAQKNSEIATFKQQVGALKDKAIQSQKAQMSTKEKAAEQAPEATPAPQQEAIATESLVPRLADFLREEAKYAPYLETPDGTVYMDGKPRFQRFKKKVEREFTDKDWEKDAEISEKIRDLEHKKHSLQSEIRELERDDFNPEAQIEQVYADLAPEVLDAFNSGMSDEEKIRIFNQNGYTAKDFYDTKETLDHLEDSISYNRDQEIALEAEIKEINDQIEKLENELSSIGVSYKDDYQPVKIQNESLNEEDEDEVVRDPNEDNPDIFYVQIPPQTEIQGEVIAKVFREEEGKRWYVRDVEGDADFLDELVFQRNWDKVEIISYLAGIFGDVIEIDREEFDDIIDDKPELDAKYFPKKRNKNKRVKITR